MFGPNDDGQTEEYFLLLESTPPGTEPFLEMLSHLKMMEDILKDTVVATRTFSGLKLSISPSNVALNSNPGTVLETARPEDSKTPPTC